MPFSCNPLAETPCSSRPLAETTHRNESSNSFADRLAPKDEAVDLSSASTVQPVSAVSTPAQGTEGVTDESEEEVFQFPWAGEPFWQVSLFLRGLSSLGL